MAILNESKAQRQQQNAMCQVGWGKKVSQSNPFEQ
jgi:hypothetical protein